ncbi:hypothetical protein [Candidatus Berkiella aquae]|uniref:Uncharacterized protein n=1 Tax=Candidatus Berkiella aquae TaxID=295108 RepID=A0A0Q9YK29_9GAMM|nr:hypothetical protein [Candidatus Berkiella aquae]MCS5710001.1 hypothetical protein [Candidatus Berkiella aquae]
MSKINKDLLNYANEVADALNDVYAQNHKMQFWSQVGNFMLGLVDIALHGFKAKTPLLGLYHLYQAAQKPAPTLKPSMDLDLAPRPRQEPLPRPRPY